MNVWLGMVGVIDRVKTRVGVRDTAMIGIRVM